MKRPIERKVRWATAVAYLASSGLLGVMAAVQDNARVLEPMPDGISPLVLALVPGLLTYAAGWKASHPLRPDLGEE
ncbi:holin [Streptomyces sp. CC224B]|uniref:holin n=1 Tax=Streptomyces sp. CC224B TaxID=3044571 RepID=UPI0024A89FA5|nr:holin [Streptomyces sp. CC224B]